MGFLFTLLLVALNVFIAYWNARAIAPVWRYRGQMDWMMYLVTLSAFVMSVVGFSMPLILGGTFGALALGLIPAAGAKAAMGMWYLSVIVPVLGASLIITAHSWIEAWRRRDLTSALVTAWNTGATIHNFASAPSGIEAALDGIGSFVSSVMADEDGFLPGLALLLVVAIVVGSLFGGVYATLKVIAKHREDRIIEGIA